MNYSYRLGRRLKLFIEVEVVLVSVYYVRRMEKGISRGLPLTPIVLYMPPNRRHVVGDVTQPSRLKSWGCFHSRSLGAVLLA